mmetsp:Transcript_4592/g.6376  ORF Transcript_4592/g.6376 Transcript_4592/m.6376 type:complete len:130 (-) Transcript_4592:34-423(-)
MEQRSNYAAVKDAQIKLIKEAYAIGMEQSRRSNYASLKDVAIIPNEEECVEGTGHIALYMTNLLHLLYNLDQLMMRRLRVFPISTLATASRGVDTNCISQRMILCKVIEEVQYKPEIVSLVVQITYVHH